MVLNHNKAKVLIFIVSFNAERFIEKVLSRIPENVWVNDTYTIEVLVIDDQSRDDTFFRALEFSKIHEDRKIKVLYNPVNQGYGGNQKLGYHYAIDQGFDLVVLLHGDGQYAPESLDQMIRPILENKADVVLGSRMIKRLDALRGKMPFYKWCGNLTLTFFQNLLLGSKLAEFHTGYRAYRVESLKRIPFEYNSNYFDFDSDILIQLIDTKQQIKEIPIQTYYGDEISYVNGIRYGFLILATTLRSRIARLNLFYDRRFDYDERINEYYELKLGYSSSHQFALDFVKEGMIILDIGSGPGYMAKELYMKGAKVISLDKHITPIAQQYSIQTIQTEIEDFDLSAIKQNVDQIFMLDIIEHIHVPENLLSQLREHFAQSVVPPKIIVTTGNIGFFIIRFGLLLGQFNYGKKGILDRDHQRLFTFGSMKQILESTGYEILEIKGIPAPYPLVIRSRFLSHLLVTINRFLILISRGLFSYQMAFVVQPKPLLKHLLERAFNTSEKKVNERKK